MFDIGDKVRFRRYATDGQSEEPYYVCGVTVSKKWWRKDTIQYDVCALKQFDERYMHFNVEEERITAWNKEQLALPILPETA